VDATLLLLEDLWGREVIVGDIMLVKEQKGDAFEPTEFHLTRIVKP
jgi:hypothetical protein